MAPSIANLLNVFLSPSRLFENLKVRPRWFVAFVVICLLTMTVAWLTLPFSAQIFERSLRSVGDGNSQEVQSLMGTLKYLPLALAPALFLIRWLFVAGLLYFSSVLMNAIDLRFRTAFSIVVHSEMVFVLMATLNLLILYIRGPQSVQRPTDLQAVFGLDLLLSDRESNPLLFTLLNSINVFTIWYVVTLTIGMSCITEFSKWKAGALVTAVWVLGLAFQLLTLAISGGTAAS